MLKKRLLPDFKDKRNMPKVAVCVPERWEEHVRDALEYWDKETDFVIRKLEGRGKESTDKPRFQWRLPFRRG